MKIRVSCLTCINELIKEKLSPVELGQRVKFDWVTITAAKIQEWTCPEKHVNRFWFSPHFYDLLYSKALADFAREDTRSAVANFYSAWENFVSHTVKLLLKEFGVSDGIPGEVKRSEPLNGAYCALFATKVKKFPKMISSDNAGIRNAVIHSDLIPSNEQAVNLAKEVQLLIQDARKELYPLHNNYNLGLQAANRAAEDIKATGMNGVLPVWIRSQVDDNIEATIIAMQSELATLCGNGCSEV